MEFHLGSRTNSKLSFGEQKCEKDFLNDPIQVNYTFNTFRKYLKTVVWMLQDGFLLDCDIFVHNPIKTKGTLVSIGNVTTVFKPNQAQLQNFWWSLPNNWKICMEKRIAVTVISFSEEQNWLTNLLLDNETRIDKTNKTPVIKSCTRLVFQCSQESEEEI